jgi:hypothetical protein
VPIEIRIDQWQEKAASLANAVLVRYKSRRYHIVYFAGDGIEIVDYLQSVGCAETQFLTTDYWDRVGKEGCQLRLIPIVVTKHIAGRKRKKGYWPYFDTKRMAKCLGVCHIPGHICKPFKIPGAGAAVLTCECDG